MKMTSRATLAVEEDVESEDEDDGESRGSGSKEGVSSSEVCTFDVPYFRYIDDEDVEEGRDKGILNECNRSWPSCSTEKDRCASSPHRYIVVSGTPLKILEHLLSDLRLDDQRGAPESRDSGELQSLMLIIKRVVMKVSIGKGMKCLEVK